MRPRTLDRYLLRELTLPFLLALIGFLLFIFLNLILEMREWMIDRGVSFWAILRLLLYQVPWVLMFSIPVATVFAVFLALGRLSHDQEIIAFQAGGFSLKRIVLPILLAGFLLSGLDFWIGESLVPWANQEYQRTLSRLLLHRTTPPQIRDNTFFRDGSGRLFYVRHYDRGRNRLEGIMIYDLGGHDYPGIRGSSTFPVAILAREGSWEGERWVLRDGVIHQYDATGHLVRELRFQELVIEIGRGLEFLLATQRTPQEMRLKELGEQIARLRAAGLNADSLILEFHMKLALPLAVLVFALLSAPLALIFSMRSRAAGAVIGVLLIGLFQGTMIWAQTLGRRGIISPILGAWLPDILFGLLGLLLFLKMEDWNRRDFGERLRRLLHRSLLLLPVLLLAVGEAIPVPVQAQGVQVQSGSVAVGARAGKEITITAERLIAAGDLSEVEAEGGVRISYDYDYGSARLRLRSDWARVRRVQTQTGSEVGAWQLEARRGVEVRLDRGDERLSLEATELEALLTSTSAEEAEGAELIEASAHELQGEYRRSKGSFSYSAAHGRAEFAAGELRRLELAGKARLRYPRGELAAERLLLQPVQTASWRVIAQGEVRLEEGAREVTAERLEALLRLDLEEGDLKAGELHAEEFVGVEPFVNAQGATERLRYRGAEAQLELTSTEEGEPRLRRLNLRQGAFTTCSCGEILEDAYCISTARLLILSDDLLIARDVVLRLFGVPVFWAPFYITPLKEERKSPFLPEFGRSAARGWYARWQLPFLIAESPALLLLEYYNRYHQLGLGLDLEYSLAGSSGRVHLYRLFGTAGIWELALSDRTSLPGDVQLEASAGYRLEGSLRGREAGAEVETERRSYRLQLTGNAHDWDWRLSFARGEQELSNVQGQTPSHKVVIERLPEVMLSRRGKLGLLDYGLSLSWGRYREFTFKAKAKSRAEAEAGDGEGGGEGGGATSGERFNGRLSLSHKAELPLGLGLSLQTQGSYQIALYTPASRRETLSLSSTASWTPLSGLRIGLSYAYRQVSGKTPFSFDRQQAANSLVFKGDWEGGGGWRASLSGGYNLRSYQFSPWKLALSWGSAATGASLTANLVYDPGRTEKLTLQGRIGSSALAPGWSAQALLGYDFRRARWDDLILKLAWGGERLGLRFDLNNLRLRRVNAELGLGWAAWSAEVKGEFELESGKLLGFQYRLARRFCNCWELALYGERGRVWLQAQILAFPVAKVRYSPTDRALAFGR